MKNKIFDLAGCTALVTGAAGHLGREICKALAMSGAHLVLNDISKPRLNELKEEIQNSGGSAKTAVFDLCSAEEVESFFRDFSAENNSLDILINNAYAGKPGTIDSAASEDYTNSYNISVIAAARLIQLFRPLLAESGRQRPGGSSVINIASMYGLVSPDPDIYGDSGSNNPPYYGAAKAALIQLTRYMGCHLAADKIRVNSISPGPFPPPSIKVSNPEFHKKLCRKNPMGRIGKASELSGAVIFFASDAASYITGTNLAVDGGWTAW